MNTVTFVFYLYYLIQPSFGSSECFLREFSNNITIQVKITSFSLSYRFQCLGGKIAEVKLCHKLPSYMDLLKED